MSVVEFHDIEGTGRFLPGEGSLEGKGLAESLDDARRWGLWFYRADPFHIVEVSVNAVVAGSFFRLEKLDNIGPARFAEIVSLAGARVCEVRDE